MIRAVRDHINIRILQTMVSGFPLLWGLGTRMSDPCVYVVFWAPNDDVGVSKIQGSGRHFGQPEEGSPIHRSSHMLCMQSPGH